VIPSMVSAARSLLARTAASVCDKLSLKASIRRLAVKYTESRLV
jgi:hypothetical protein